MGLCGTGLPVSLFLGRIFLKKRYSFMQIVRKASFARGLENRQ